MYETRNLINRTSGNDIRTSGYDTPASGYDPATSGYDTPTSGYDTRTSGYDTFPGFSFVLKSGVFPGKYFRNTILFGQRKWMNEND